MPLSYIFDNPFRDTPLGHVCRTRPNIQIAKYPNIWLIWLFGYLPACAEHAQVGYPCKEHKKCSSEALTLGPQDIPVKSYRPKTIFANSPFYIPCNTAELRWGTFPTCYDDFENCSEQPKTNKMGINTAPIKFLTFGFLAPPNHTFSHHYQGSIDFNTVNIQRTIGMYFLVHSLGSRECIGYYDLYGSYPLISTLLTVSTRKYIPIVR